MERKMSDLLVLSASSLDLLVSSTTSGSASGLAKESPDAPDQDDICPGDETWIMVTRVRRGRLKKKVAKFTLWRKYFHSNGKNLLKLLLLELIISDFNLGLVGLLKKK